MTDHAELPLPRPLQGRVALVTGGSRGIGAACAAALATRGAAIGLIGRSADDLERAAARLAAAHGVPTTTAAADATDRSALRDAIAAVRAALGPITVLVNNVGGTTSAPLDSVDDAAWDAALSLNLTSVFVATRAVLADMRDAGFGRVVTIASTAAQKGYAYVAPYCAAKHGALGFTRALAIEVAREPITVNAVCPGFVDTEMTARSIAGIVAATGRDPADARRALEAMSPQRRLVRPDEVAAAVAWLCDPAQAAVTGQALGVAGGEVMH